MGASPHEQIRRGQSPGAQANSPGPTLLGFLSLLPPQFRWTIKNFYGYNTTFSPLSASSTATKQIAIASDSHFIICYATCIVTDTANTTQIPFIPQLVMLTDSAAQSNLFLSAVHAMSLYGDASNPGVLSVPYILSPSTTLGVQHQNQEATDRNVYVAFYGLKSYPNTDTRDPRWQGQ